MKYLAIISYSDEDGEDCQDYFTTSCSDEDKLKREVARRVYEDGSFEPENVEITLIEINSLERLLC